MSPHLEGVCIVCLRVCVRLNSTVLLISVYLACCATRESSIMGQRDNVQETDNMWESGKLPESVCLCPHV